MADQLLGNYQHVIETFTLIPSRGGVFELKVDEDVVFSKKELKRHAEEGEILALFEKIVGPDVPKYE